MHRVKANLVRCSLFVTLLALVVTLVGLCCLAVETLYICWGPARSTSQCLLKNIYNKNYLFKVKTHTRLDIVKAIIKIY